MQRTTHRSPTDKCGASIITRLSTLFCLVLALVPISGTVLHAQLPTPGFTHNFVAGEAPDGDNDNRWESTAGNANFDYTFNNGSQTPTAVNDEVATFITHAYAFPAGRSTSGTGTTLGASQDVTIELWFKPSDLIGNEILYEFGGNGNGTSLILLDNQLQLTTQSGNSNRMQASVTLPPESINQFNQAVATIDLLGGSAASCTLTLNGNAATDSGSITQNYDAFAGGSTAGLGRISVNFAGDDVLTGVQDFSGDIAILRIYLATALSPSEILHNYETIANHPPEITTFSASPTNGVGTTSIQLDWTTTNATGVVISPLPGSLPLNGSTNLIINTTTVFSLTATNSARSTQSHAQVVIDGQLLDPVINEFLASNDITLDDGDGRSSDWIEIYNPNALPFDLSGWSLTDSTNNLTRWPFPAITMQPFEYLVIFASGQSSNTYVDAEGNFHTNFKLNSDGEYLALVDPTTNIVVAFEPGYPEQATDISYGPQGVYYDPPTPGSANGQAFDGLVSDTTFDQDRGFYTNAFNVTISTATSNAVIRYTLDGSAPTENSGTVYTNPIPINTTATLRAAAFKAGFKPTNVDTHTYIFLADVMQQPANPAGWPTSWAGRPADYEMDPDVIGPANLFTNVYREAVTNAMLSIPTMSIVTETNHLFGPQGVYDNPQSSGVAWERPCSIEYFQPDGKREIQLNCGLRIHGGSSRSPNYPKHNFRLLFKREYGSTKLRFDLFKGQPSSGNATAEFDTIILRAGFNNSWTHWHWYQNPRAQYVRDQFVRDTQLDMGHPSPHGMYVHLYVNGMYWGLYNPSERPSAPFLASYLGGDKEDYDALNVLDPVDGDAQAWNTLTDLGKSGLTSYASWTNVLEWLDPVNLADYMLLNFYVGNDDWDGHNFYVGRKREAGAGYKFLSWDAELIISRHQNPPQVYPDFDVILNRDRTGLNSNNKPSSVHQDCTQNPEYRLLFADRIHKHLFNDGALTQTNIYNRWMARRNQIWEAVVAESARWGDYRRDVLQGGSNTPEDYDLFHRDTHYVAQENWLFGTYFPQRRDIVLNQFRNRNLWPDTMAPALNRHGGLIPSGFTVAMTNLNASGTIYYTVDGSDPREPGTSNPTGTTYTNAFSTTQSITIKARVHNTDNEWSPLTEATFEIPADDTDLDTLSDTWEITWFTNLNQDAEADFDGDGHSNGTEEFIGTDPTDPASRFLLAPRMAAGNVVLEFPFAPDPDYTLQVSNDLEQWINVEGMTIEGNTIQFSPTDIRRYYRLIAQ